MIEGLKLAKACADAADYNKAENIRVFDLRGMSSITDFIVICSGTSAPHLKGILRDMDKSLLQEHQTKPLRTEGMTDARWVVLDYVDVMVHVMLDDMRELYNLESLWSDAKVVDWESASE